MPTCHLFIKKYAEILVNMMTKTVMSYDILDHVGLALRFLSILLVVVSIISPWVLAKWSYTITVAEKEYRLSYSISANIIGNIKTDNPTDTENYRVDLSIRELRALGGLIIFSFCILLMTTLMWVYMKYISPTDKMEKFSRICMYDLIFSIIIIGVSLIVMTTYSGFKLSMAIYLKYGETTRLLLKGTTPLYTLAEGASIGLGPMLAFIGGVLWFVATILHGIAINKKIL